MQYLEILSLRYLLLFIWNWNATECPVFYLAILLRHLLPITLPYLPPYEFHYYPFVFLYNVTICVLIPKCSLFLPVLDCHGDGGFPFFLNHVKSKLHSPLTHVMSSLVSVMLRLPTPWPGNPGTQSRRSGKGRGRSQLASLLGWPLKMRLATLTQLCQRQTVPPVSALPLGLADLGGLIAFEFQNSHEALSHLSPNSSTF